MTGLKISQPLSKELTVGFSQKVPGELAGRPRPRPGCRRPTQKARPLPVTMATHASSSSRKRVNASLRSRRISPLMALRVSGRL